MKLPYMRDGEPLYGPPRVVVLSYSGGNIVSFQFLDDLIVFASLPAESTELPEQRYKAGGGAQTAEALILSCSDLANVA